MSAKRLDGKVCAAEVETELTQRIDSLKAYGIQPHLAVIIVGNDPASHVYVNSKVRMCERIGICLLYTSPSPRDGLLSRMPSSA